MTAAQRDFPLPTACEDVFHCGFASEYSFGATSWLVRRAEGNVMMDSPRYHPGLAKRLKVRPTHCSISCCPLLAFGRTVQKS